MDTSGHGTHVCGIAAGDGSSSDSGYVGLAPKAPLIVVKLDRTQAGRIEDGIAYVAKRAHSLGLPWVVNLSQTVPYTSPTARDGSQRTEQFIDSVVLSPDVSLGTGRVIVCAVGNDAAYDLHASREGDGAIQLSIGTDSNPYQIVDRVKVCVLYRGWDAYDPAISVISPDGDTVGPVHCGCVSGFAQNLGWVADTNSQTTDGLVRVFHGYFNEQVYGPESGDPIIAHPYDTAAVIDLGDGIYNPTSTIYQLRPGTWTITMQGLYQSATWDAYIYDRDTADNKYFDSTCANPDRTISSPATAEKCIAVGSINSTRHYWTDAMGYGRTVPFSTFPPGDVSFFSNLGPTRSGAFKPELYAPGAWIMSSRSSDVTENNFANDTTLIYHDIDSVHAIWFGTSLAAPHVTGAAALVLDWNGDLSADEVKLALTSGADLVSVYRQDLNVDSTLYNLHGFPGQRNPESADGLPLPETFTLYQNYPNPFNPSTRIEFEVPNQSAEIRSKVRIDIYNILGQRITTLVDGYLSPGPYSLWWNGTTATGEKVASGVYLYRCVCNGSADTKKMVLLK